MAGRVWMPRSGASVLTFVCKATFALVMNAPETIVPNTPIAAATVNRKSHISKHFEVAHHAHVFVFQIVAMENVSAAVAVETHQQAGSLAGAQIAEDRARAQKAILVKFAQAKHVKELEGQVFKAKREELGLEASWLRERSKEEKLRREITACRVVAPIDGVVGYLRPVAEGDAFRWGEVVFRIFPEPTPRSKTEPK